MTNVVACVLALDGWRMAQRAVASARRFGLDVVLGVVDGEGDVDMPGVACRSIKWRDDLADARNHLAATADAEWALWLEDDEELTAYNAGRLAGLKGSIAAVRLHDRAGFTARPALRLQALRSYAHWVGAVAETLSADDVSALVTLEGIRLDSFAFETPERIHQKHSRDRALAARAREAGDDSFGVGLAAARAEEAENHGARAFKHPGAKPAAPGAPDPRIEAAEQLCSYDYTKPAILLLKDNPAIAGMCFQLLTAKLWSGAGSMKISSMTWPRALPRGSLIGATAFRTSLSASGAPCCAPRSRRMSGPALIRRPAIASVWECRVKAAIWRPPRSRATHPRRRLGRALDRRREDLVRALERAGDKFVLGCQGAAQYSRQQGRAARPGLVP